MANSVDPDQTAPIGAVCSGSTLFVSILNSSVMLVSRHGPFVLPLYFDQKMLTANYFCCIFSNTLKKPAIKAITMNPDQTNPTGAA